MTNNELRLIALRDPELIRTIALNDADLATFEYVSDHPNVGSVELAQRFALRIPNASRSLASLHSKGYLVRERSVESPGQSHRYNVAPELGELLE